MANPERSVFQPSPSPENVTADVPEVALIIEGAPLPSLHDVEQRYITRVLEVAHGNQRQAAHLLGISRWSLSRRLRKYGVRPRTAA
jgi:DNA-binding NtrC family response regulator